MARVFLSYDRDDAAKARTLAGALESAGHTVWWDFHIRGGTEYGKEIEQALNDAEAVVVLWSRDSVESPWVRDEAAAGRDRGRMVPVRLDDTNPPMGFRQYQNVDLSGWKGHGKPAGLQEILACVDRLADEQKEPSIKAPRAAGRGRRLWPRAAQLSLIVAFVIAAITAAYLLVNGSGSPRPPIVSVVAADNSQSARSLADDLFIKLGSLQSVNAEALHLTEQGSVTDPDLSFRVAQKSVDGRARATVALLANDGTLLWSREFAQEQRSTADLEQQVAYSAALVLNCATEAMGSSHEKIGHSTLKLYLGGCARLGDEFYSDPRPLLDVFGKVVGQAPDFQGGWAKLLMVETFTWLTSGNDRTLAKSLRTHIGQAQKLNPTMAEALVADAWMQQLSDISRWMPLSEAAVANNPSNSYALTEHSNDMFQVGRLQQGVTFARTAVQADPLSPWVRDALIGSLIYAGEIEAAKRSLEEAERLWPGASNLIKGRFYLMARNGDPREALLMLRSGKVSRENMSPAMESFLEARIDPVPAKVDRAVSAARAVANRWYVHYVETLGEFRRKEELIKSLSEHDPGDDLGPAHVFQPKFGFLQDDIRFMAIMAKWKSQLDYWRRSGNWPDFCFKPDLPYDCKVEAAKLAEKGRQAGKD